MNRAVKKDSYNFSDDEVNESFDSVLKEAIKQQKNILNENDKKIDYLIKNNFSDKCEAMKCVLSYLKT